MVIMAYSLDLRKRVLDFIRELAVARLEASRRFSVARSTLYRVVRMHLTHSTRQKPGPRRPRTLDPDALRPYMSLTFQTIDPTPNVQLSFWCLKVCVSGMD